MKIIPLLYRKISAIKSPICKFSTYKKIFTGKDTFALQKRKNFKELQFKKCSTLEEATLFTAQNFEVKHFDINSITCANIVNRTLTQIHNITNGQQYFHQRYPFITKHTLDLQEHVTISISKY